jgi:hypothetical protein
MMLDVSGNKRKTTFLEIDLMVLFIKTRNHLYLSLFLILRHSSHNFPNKSLIIEQLQVLSNKFDSFTDKWEYKIDAVDKLLIEM